MKSIDDLRDSFDRIFNCIEDLEREEKKAKEMFSVSDSLAKKVLDRIPKITISFRHPEDVAIINISSSGIDTKHIFITKFEVGKGYTAYCMIDGTEKFCAQNSISNLATLLNNSSLCSALCDKLNTLSFDLLYMEKELEDLGKVINDEKWRCEVQRENTDTG